MLGSRKSVVGLDIGSSCIKAVEITRDRYDYVITGYHQIDVGSEAVQSEAIADLFNQARFRTKRVITSVSGKQVIVRYITMVNMTSENLQNAIRFEADKYVPFDLEDCQLDCQKLSDVTADSDDGEGEMRVLLVAVKRNLVEEKARMLSTIGLRPVAVDVDAFALGTVFEMNEGLSSTIDDPDKVVALVDIGANKTCVNILKGNLSHFTREVYIGGNDMTNAINRRLDVEHFEAELLKRNPGDRQVEVEEAVNPVIEDLANEVSLSFDYFESQTESDVAEVQLSGGGSLLRGLDETLERIFEKSTKIWNPIEGFKVKSDNVDIESLNHNSTQLAVAVGLASRMS